MHGYVRIVLTGLLLLQLLGEWTSAGTRTADSRPNIIVILVDDFGYTDLGCYGSSFYETPHVDRLAKEGLRFTQAYSACPVCSPTRAALLTGRYPWRTGVTDYINLAGQNQPQAWNRNTRKLPAAYADRLPLSEVTLAELLKEQGYATFHCGKWHLGPAGFYPEDQGFDINVAGVAEGGPSGPKKHFSPYRNPRLSDGPPGEYLTDRMAMETVKFLKTPRTQPCFVYLPFYAVHTPLMAPEALVRKYEEKRIRRALQTHWGHEGERKVLLNQEHPVYAAMVENMDAAVGQVLQAISDLHLDRQTIVLFTSDNGGLSTSEGHPTSNLPLRAGKGWLYEGGIRVPLIVRWTGKIAAGRVSDDPVSTVDYLPTLLDLAGLPIPTQLSLDGQSLKSHLLNETPVASRDIVWHYPHYGNQGGAPGSALRNGPWKLIYWEEEQTTELFNLDHDLSERSNLAERHPEIVKAMSERLHTFLQQTNAQHATPNPKFAPQQPSGRREADRPDKYRRPTADGKQS